MLATGRPRRFQGDALTRSRRLALAPLAFAGLLVWLVTRICVLGAPPHAHVAAADFAAFKGAGRLVLQGRAPAAYGWPLLSHLLTTGFGAPLHNTLPIYYPPPFMLLPRQPCVAGVVLRLLCCKPQVASACVCAAVVACVWRGPAAFDLKAAALLCAALLATHYAFLYDAVWLGIAGVFLLGDVMRGGSVRGWEATVLTAAYLIPSLQLFVYALPVVPLAAPSLLGLAAWRARAGFATAPRGGAHLLVVAALTS